MPVTVPTLDGAAFTTVAYGPSHPRYRRPLQDCRVVGRGLVSIAEVHATVAGTQLAQSEPEMARDRFGAPVGQNIGKGDARTKNGVRSFQERRLRSLE
jgi:hypothetical protein